jgi:hypothetical protein
MQRVTEESDFMVERQVERTRNSDSRFGLARMGLLLAALAIAPSARADFATFVIDDFYSSADGTVQYIVLHETQGANGGNLLAGRTITSTSIGGTKVFTFSTDLPSATTAGRRVLIGSNGFAAKSALTPDYQMPDRFLPTDGGTVDYAGVDQITFASLPIDGTNALQHNGTIAANLATNFAGGTFSFPAIPITVIEFYNESLDHYFMSPLAPDIDALDSGRFAGWSRTGYAFEGFVTLASAGSTSVSPVCRFYIPPEHGDSHFFSASPAECAEVLAKIGTDPNYSGYVYETPSEFYITLPDTATGACAFPPLPSTATPSVVYRLWNQRVDSNHRYTADAGVRLRMIARNYLPEGYGPLGVAMCTLNARIADSRVRVSGLSPFGAGCDNAPVTSALFTNAEVEPMIAVNLANPGNLIGVWQQDRWSDGGAAGLRTGVSFDSGRSWAFTQARFSRCSGGTAANGGDFARASDPWVAITPAGTAFQAAIAFNGGTFAAGSQNAVLVSRSVDGGVTWSTATTLILDGSSAFNDKDSIAADRYRDGYVYAVWDRIVPTGNGPTYFSRTTDNGVTWEPARPIFDPGSRSQTLNNQIVALPPATAGGPNTIVDFFTQIDTSTTNVVTNRLALIRSSDNGATWGTPIYIADIQALGTTDPERGTELRDGATLGSFAGGTNGQLAVAWQDARFSGGLRDGIAFARSIDGGLTWTAPVQVNSVPTVQALLPAVTIRDDGTLGVLYYDMRNNTSDVNTLLVDAWLATSKDGVVWQETHVGGPFNFTNAPTAAGGLFIGDYQGLASTDTAFYPFFVITNADIANRTDVFASAFRSIVAVAKEGDVLAKTFRARTAPALQPGTELQQRLQARIKRTLEWRRIGAADSPARHE